MQRIYTKDSTLELVKSGRCIAFILPAYDCEDNRIGQLLYLESETKTLTVDLAAILELYVWGLTEQHFIDAGGYSYTRSMEDLTDEYGALSDKGTLINILYVKLPGDETPLKVKI